MTTPQKPTHKRTARAEARLRLVDYVRAELDSSLLQTARVAGMMAARQAGQILPQAAAAEIASVEVTFEWEAEGLVVSTHVSGYARAPLGSRALLAAQVCATAIVDAFAERAGAVALEHLQITEQRGGQEGLEYDFDPPIKVSIVSISDAVAAGHKEDRAGAAVEAAVAELEHHGVELAGYKVLADDAGAIEETVSELVDADTDLVLTVGGTGLAHTDVTVETVEPMLDRPIPGLMEALRTHGQEHTPVAFMSRGVAGLVDDTLVVTLPGSTGGATESCQALFPGVLHVFKTLRKSKKALKG